VAISAVIIVRDEQHALLDRIPELGLEDVVVLDNGSSDATRSVAQALGARVFDTSEMFLSPPIRKRDVERYTRLMGFAPTFEVGDVFQDNGARREWGCAQAKNDWVYCPDADEQTTWDVADIVRLTETCDHLRYPFINEHNPDGSPKIELVNSKLFDRRKSHWQGSIHEVVVPDLGAVTMYTDTMRVDHWQRPKEYRTESMKKLEFQHLRHQSCRSTYYLGREYLLFGKPELGRLVLGGLLKMTPAWKTERAAAYMLLSGDAKARGDLDLAIAYSHGAMMDDDSRREPFYQVAEIHFERKEWHSARIYCAAALAIPFEAEEAYLMDLSLYDGRIENMLANIAHNESR
jgi:hypothetical protein